LHHIEVDFVLKFLKWFSALFFFFFWVALHISLIFTSLSCNIRTPQPKLSSRLHSPDIKKNIVFVLPVVTLTSAAVVSTAVYWLEHPFHIQKILSLVCVSNTNYPGRIFMVRPPEANRSVPSNRLWPHPLTTKFIICKCFP
jgi:hypothetical protein